VSLATARKRVGDRVALQGNLDPLVLLATPEVVRKEAERVLADFGPGPGHVFNLGHGIVPQTPPEHVAALVAAVHAASARYHAGAASVPR
jgi:uroporphyrinogen decarboxylase